jgi:hypothetical protein
MAAAAPIMKTGGGSGAARGATSAVTPGPGMAAAMPSAALSTEGMTAAKAVRCGR